MRDESQEAGSRCEEGIKDGIEISMEDYGKSLEEIEIREDWSDETLTKDKLKILRKYF